jgi:hypothetical protein
MNSDRIIEFKLLKHQELKSFQEFIKNHWQKDHLFAQEKSVFDWQHKGPNAYHCMVAKQNGNIVGVHGVIPLSHFDKNLPKNQIFLALWRVLEDKGIGIGLCMFKEILAKYKPEFIAGLGINPRVLAFFKWQGFECDIMDHHIVLSPFVKDFKVAEVPENLKVQSQREESLASFQKLTIKQLRDLETEILYLHQLPVKSDTYIINRYMNHPVYKYNVYSILKDNMVKALCIIRPIFKEDSVVLSCVDFIGQNDDFPLLHDFIFFLLKEYNAEYFDFYSYGIPQELIRKAGFINRKDVKNLIVPGYFEPFEKKNVEISFGYKNLQTHIPVRIFKGDGDSDRPSKIQGYNEYLNN